MGCYPKDIDPEVVPLCDALNSIPGVETSYSCSGHGTFAETRRSFHVTVLCHSAEAMNHVLHLVNPRRYSGGASKGQQGSPWHAEALQGHGYAHIRLSLSPARPKNTADAVLAADDLIQEIRWLQDHGELPRNVVSDDPAPA